MVRLDQLMHELLADPHRAQRALDLIARGGIRRGGRCVVVGSAGRLGGKGHRRRSGGRRGGHGLRVKIRERSRDDLFGRFRVFGFGERFGERGIEVGWDSGLGGTHRCLGLGERGGEGVGGPHFRRPVQVEGFWRCRRPGVVEFAGQLAGCLAGQRGSHVVGQRRSHVGRSHVVGQRGSAVAGERGSAVAGQRRSRVVLVVAVEQRSARIAAAGLDFDERLLKEAREAAGEPALVADHYRVLAELGNDRGDQLIDGASAVDARRKVPGDATLRVWVAGVASGLPRVQPGVVVCSSLTGSGPAGCDVMRGGVVGGGTHAWITPIVSTLTPGAISL